MPQHELSISSGLAPGISRSTSSTGCTAPKAFWWQWPCTQHRRVGRRCSVEREAAGRGLAGEELLEQQRLRRDDLRRRRPGPSPAPRRAASAGTTAPGRRRRCRACANGSSASISAPRLRLGLVDHAGGQVGAAAAQVAAALARPRAPRSRRPAARAPRRMAFSVSKVPLKVSTNSTDRLAPAAAAALVAAWRAAATARRAPEGVAAPAAAASAAADRPSQRSLSARRAGQLVAQVEQPRQPAGRRARSRAGARPAGPSACGRGAPCSAPVNSIFILRHVDAGRAVALAALAADAQVHASRAPRRW